MHWVGGITRDKNSILKSKGLGKLHWSSQTSLNFPYILGQVSVNYMDVPWYIIAHIAALYYLIRPNL